MAEKITRIFNIAKSYKTDKPTGLSITRNGEKFTLSWKCGDKNYDDAQLVQWRVNDGKWHEINPKKKTATSVSLTFGNYYPAEEKKLKTLEFRVRGARDAWTKTVTKKETTGKGNKKKTIEKIYHYYYTPEMSDWSSKTYTFKKPDNPKTSASWSEDYVNRTTFTVTEAAPTDAANVSRRVDWESVLVTNCNYTSGKDAPWSASQAGWLTGTMSASGGSKAIDESALGTASYTRWFRARAKGVRGDSEKWSYAKHVYATPNKADITYVKATTGGSTYNVIVRWNANESVARPIDETTIQYLIATPTATGGAPSDGWQDSVTLKDTQKTDGTTIEVPRVCGEDEALFIRVATKHDTHVSVSSARRPAVGYVAAPSGLTASVNDTTHKADIECENNSDIPGSFTVISVMYKSGNKTITSPVVILPNGTTRATGVTLPTTRAGSTLTFRAQTFAGSYTAGTTKYTSYMSSATITYGTSIPAAPTGLTLSSTSVPGTIRATWTWSWSAANVAELSWSDHSDAWQSTDEPSTYEIGRKATAWNISGLEAGVTWYVRVRLGLSDGDDVTWSEWSGAAEIVLSSAPVVPVLELSAGVITARGTVDASWVYVTSDGTGQASARLAEVTYSGQTPSYRTIATVTTAQTVTVSARRQGWATGSTHLLAVRVTSGSGHLSDDWSAPVPVIVANAVTCTIASTSLETVTETIDGETDTFTALTEMPLEITVTGAKAGGTTSVIIERADEYFLDRPDEEISRGYEGETIAVYSQQGESAITITNDMLIGHLDDGAKYRIIATTQDSYGQSASATQDFRVRWTDQAIMPTAGAIIDEGATYAIIIPMLPNDVPATSDTENAVADIYRLSVDKPVLIYEGATFGEMYVDPYPTIGEYGGHRIVYRSKNGDYITEENTLAWVDLDEADGDFLDVDYNIIEWDTGVVRLEYNVDLSNSWTKDFTETQYLGGSVQGDWNPAVHREGSLSGVAIATDDTEVIQAMRRLAVHAGICHVRTKDGSNYAADVQVSESYKQGTSHKIVEFSLKITRVDTQTLDGMTLAAWEELNSPNWDNFVEDNEPYLMRKTGGTIYDGD